MAKVSAEIGAAQTDAQSAHEESDNLVGSEFFKDGTGARDGATGGSPGSDSAVGRRIAGAAMAEFADNVGVCADRVGRGGIGLALPALALGVVAAAWHSVGDLARRAGDGCAAATCAGRA
jgi:hypothetical protein